MKLGAAFVLALLAMPMVLLLLFVGDDEQKPLDPNCLPDLPSAPQITGRVAAPMREGDYTMTSGFGPRWGAQHQGVDMAGPIGKPIYAAHDGIVRESGPASGFGEWIVLDTLEGDPTPMSTVYGHIDTREVQAGDTVTAGDLIATVGNKGESTGPHLHFETWYPRRIPDGAGTARDPIEFLNQVATTPPAEVELVARPQPFAIGCGAPPVPASAGLAPGSVPPLYAQWLTVAGSICPEYPPALAAAQIRQEQGGFRDPAPGTDEVSIGSPAGAQGPAQFMKATWDAHGVDGDGDGDVTRNSIADSIVSMGHHMCDDLFPFAKDGLAKGNFQGDLTELALAAYNAGPGAVQLHNGVPPYPETQHYVKVIPQTWMPQYQGEVLDPQLPAGGSGAVVQAAARWDGTPYVWGGGDAGGPTKGGFDCSGLTLHAIAAASGGKLVLPHNTVSQLNDPRGQKVDPRQIQPGDLLFPAGGNPGHVAIYAGDGTVWHAPTFGQTVTRVPVESAVTSNFEARRYL